MLVPRRVTKRDSHQKFVGLSILPKKQGLKQKTHDAFIFSPCHQLSIEKETPLLPSIVKRRIPSNGLLIKPTFDFISLGSKWFPNLRQPTGFFHSILFSKIFPTLLEIAIASDITGAQLWLCLDQSIDVFFSPSILKKKMPKAKILKSSSHNLSGTKKSPTKKRQTRFGSFTKKKCLLHSISDRDTTSTHAQKKYSNPSNRFTSPQKQTSHPHDSCWIKLPR